jgi:site-specific DNA-methyltransferase (adenine-specific)
MATARIEQADALDFVRGLASGSVDCVVTDPPHEGLEKHRAHGTTTRLVRRWFETQPLEAIAAVLAECYRVLKPDAYCWVFADAWLEHHLARWLTGGALGDRFPGAWCWWGSWVWVKTGKPGMGYHGRRSHEHVMLFEKGHLTMKRRDQPDVIEAPRPTKKSLGGRDPYPTEKPVSVIAKLLLCSVDPGGLVLDPWCGSGSVAEATVRQGVDFVGCDSSAEAVDIARERVIVLG